MADLNFGYRVITWGEGYLTWRRANALAPTVSNVARLMARYGRAATLRRRTVVDASTWPPTTHEDNFSVTICDIVSNNSPNAGEPAPAEGRRLYVFSEVSPEMSLDALVIDGVEHAISMLRELAPAGDVGLWECLARRPR